MSPQHASVDPPGCIDRSGALPAQVPLAVAHTSCQAPAVARQDARLGVAGAARTGALPPELAHDIRAPIAGVLGLGAMLLDTRLDARQHEYAAALHRSAGALLHLVDGWLDMAQLDTGTVELESADFELDSLVGEVLDLFAPQATAQGLALGASFEAGCPHRLRGDSLRLRQVLANLVGNAVKFTARGSVEVALAAADAGAGRVRLRVQVCDTGIGIDPRARQRLFQPFRQADASVARRYGGSGLGLALSRRLVERMGGRIGVDSKPGHGSTFWFTALLAAAGADTTDPSATPLQARRTTRRTLPASGLPDGLRIGPDNTQASGGAARRVLVAEDDRAGQMVAAPLLRQAGFRVSMVGNGAEAVEAARRGSCDLILMDVRMPLMDGLEATRRIRALASAAARIPVVAMTAARITQSERGQCQAAGMNDWIAKPLDAAALGRVLDRWLPAGEPAGARTGGQPDQPACPPAAPAAPLFDATVLDGLLTAMTPAQLDELVRTGLQSCRDCIERLRDLADAGDAARLSREAHDLCGTAGTLGAVRLAHRAAELERACERVDLARARRLVTTIERDAPPTWAALHARIGVPSGPATTN